VKDLPYFKFYPAEWMKGDITDCSMEAQGLFINICVLYWLKGCELTLTRIERKFNVCSTSVQELINEDIISLIDDQIQINFLDEQFSQFEKSHDDKIRAGRISAAKRKANRCSTDVQQVVNNKEERRENKNKRRDIVFKPPQLSEVREYCSERGGKVDADKWFDYYTANGWRVGRNKMIDWRAAVRTWEKNGFAEKQKNLYPGYKDSSFD